MDSEGTMPANAAIIEGGLAALAAGCTEDQFVEELRWIGSEASDYVLRTAYRELCRREYEEAPHGD